jgi:lipopolysaccharide biosynthesis glycosyltransferase
MSNNVINIVLTCDDRYVQHAAVTIISVVKNTKRNVHFYVFDCGILPENLERLKQLNVGSNVLEVIQVQKIEAFENREYHNGYSPAVMYRLLIPKILPHLDKALYLDSDIIAVRDIGLVYDLDLGDKLLAGEPEVQPFGLFRSPSDYDGFKKYIHIASCFLLMNLGKMREWNFCEKAIEVVKNAPSFTCPNQGILYLLLEDYHWKVLNYSFFHYLMLNHDTIYPAVCYHCSFKPWLFPEVLMRFLPGMYWNIVHKYYKYLKFTPWADCKNKYVTLRTTVEYLVKWLLHRSWFRDRRMAPFESIIEEIKKA